MTIATGITVPDAAIAELCKRYEIAELAVFGSAARDEMRPDSDVDILVEFLPDARPGLLEIGGIMEELSALFGRPVDVAIKRALKPRIRPYILADARILYAA